MRHYTRKNRELTLCQVRTATCHLVPIWYRGGRCSQKQAESIAAQLARTQQRKAKARRSHGKETVRK
jgi:hypothetical protein